MCDELFGSLRSPISFKTLIHQQLNHSSEIRGNSTCPARHSCCPPTPSPTYICTSINIWPNEGCLKASEIQYLDCIPDIGEERLGQLRQTGGLPTGTIGQVTSSTCKEVNLLFVLLIDCGDFCCLLFIYLNIYKRQMFIYLTHVL